MTTEPADRSSARTRAKARAGGASQTDVVVQGIKKLIIDGKIRPGERLPVEKVLAEVLGVSRNPLREGVRALSIMGVLETRQGDGTYVTSLDSALLLAPMGFVVDLHDRSGAHHLHAVRRVLETEAAGQAAQLITPEQLTAAQERLHRIEEELTKAEPNHATVIDNDIAFHQIIAQASGNPVLAALIEALGGRTIRDRLWRSISQQGADEATHAEHRSILTALAAHDPERARTRMAAHLFAVEDYLHEQPTTTTDTQPTQ